MLESEHRPMHNKLIWGEALMVQFPIKSENKYKQNSTLKFIINFKSF